MHPLRQKLRLKTALSRSCESSRDSWHRGTSQRQLARREGIDCLPAPAPPSFTDATWRLQSCMRDSRIHQHAHRTHSVAVLSCVCETIKHWSHSLVHRHHLLCELHIVPFSMLHLVSGISSLRQFQSTCSNDWSFLFYRLTTLTIHHSPTLSLQA